MIIDFKLEKVSYHLELDSKITFIRGNSGIGKTHLVEELESYYRSYTENNLNTALTISDGYKMVILPEFVDDGPLDNITDNPAYRVDFRLFLKRRIGSWDESKVIFMTDERSDYVNSRDFQKAVNNSQSLFIFVDRDPLYSIPYGWNCVKTLKLQGNTNVLIPYRDITANVNAYDCKAVYCEDSKSGIQLFKSIAGNSQQVQTFLGKDYLVKFWSTHRDVLFVVDSFGCGAALCKLISLLDMSESLSYNYIYLIGSFEHMLLTSEFARRGNIKSGFVLREPEINEWNVEEFYTKELSRFCLEALKMRKGYHKKDLANCFIEACKSVVSNCVGLADESQSDCNYRVSGTLQDKLRTLVPEDLYKVLINLQDQSEVDCDQFADNAVGDESNDSKSQKTELAISESDNQDPAPTTGSDVATNLFG